MPRATNRTTAAKQPPASSTPARTSSKATSKSPTKKAPVKQAAASSSPVAKPAKKAAAAKKAPVAKKAAVTKAAPAAKSTPAAKKAPAVKKAPVAKSTAKPALAQKAVAAKAPAPTAAASVKKASAKKPPAMVKAANPFTQQSAAAKAAAPPRKLTAADIKFIEAQRVLMIDERATYLRQADSLKAEADSLAELREPGDVQFDEESGEGDTLAVERERDLALSHQARAAVEEIDHAMTKIELGTYGICEVSGQPIPRERLKAIPWARERVEFKVGGFGRR